MNMPLTPPALTKVLVVDDDPALRRLLADYLNRNGYDTLIAEDARDLEERLERYHPHLLLLDRMLPDGDGADVCRRLRQGGNHIPIIMLSGRDAAKDKIDGLQAGADDYLGKPFSPHELIARMQAVLRRQRHPLQVRQQTVEFGPFSFDLSARLLSRQGVLIKLTTGETNLLEALIKNATKPLSRTQLLALVHDTEQSGRTTRAVDIAILRLRRALEDDPAQPRWIQTVWGVGYCFSPGAAHVENVPSAEQASAQTTQADAASADQ